jgi:hypothetical protein
MIDDPFEEILKTRKVNNTVPNEQIHAYDSICLDATSRHDAGRRPKLIKSIDYFLGLDFLAAFFNVSLPFCFHV